MDWGTILELLTSAAGTRMQYEANRDAMRRQQQAIAAAQAEQAALGQRRQAQVIQTARAYQPEAQMQQLEQVIAPQRERLEGVAQQAATAMQTPAPAGAASRYTVDAARRNATELQRAIAEAGQMARAGGGGRLMFEQGMHNAQGASDVDNITSLMQQAARESQNRITNAERVDPRRMFAGGSLIAAAPVVARTMTGL